MGRLWSLDNYLVQIACQELIADPMSRLNFKTSKLPRQKRVIRLIFCINIIVFKTLLAHVIITLRYSKLYIYFFSFYKVLYKISLFLVTFDTNALFLVAFDI